MLVRNESQQLAGEATVPDSVICSCQIYKYGTDLLFFLERVLDALRQQGDLIYGGLPTPKTRLFSRKQGVNKGFDAGVDKSLEDLVGNTEQRDRAITLWVLYRFRRLRDRDYKRSSPDLRDCEMAHAGRKEAT